MVKYLINKDEVSENEFFRSLEENSNNVNDENAFDASLDDICSVTILGNDYSASYVLKEVDPTAYRTRMSDWQSEQYNDVVSNLDNRGIINLGGDLFEIVNEDFEEDDYVDESLNKKVTSVFEWKARFNKKNRSLKEGNDLSSAIKELENEINSLGESLGSEEDDNTDVEGCENEVRESCKRKYNEATRREMNEARRRAKRKELIEAREARIAKRKLRESNSSDLDTQLKELSNLINSL